MNALTEPKIAMTRLIDAPREVVWDACNLPEHVRRWWGCGEMTTPVCEIDLRPGGAYRIVSRDPSGAEYPMKGVYREVVRPLRTVCTQVYDAPPFDALEAIVTVTLTEKEGKTELRSEIAFPTVDAFEGARASGMEAGMAESLDRLVVVANELNAMNETQDRELRVTRLLDIPCARLFDAWTRPELLSQWFAPKPWSVSEARIDPVPGGEFAVTMRDPEGNAYPVEGVILEIVENRRIVWTDAFTKGWLPRPDLFIVGTIAFEEEDGRTRYTATVRHWSVEAKERHEAMGFEQGWNQALDQLVELVS